MKKRIFTTTVVLLICFCTISLLAACGGRRDDNGNPKEYVIQYTDDSGTHQLTVTEGMPYSIDTIPARRGYTFMGLYDAEVGGTQYVSSSGASVSPYNEDKNIVLFPQFKGIDFTIILDYQGATVTGARQLTVAYGKSLPELPKNLDLEHKEFMGWYTAPECEGVQIADAHGLIPLVSVINEDNFDINHTTITLYAGFELEKYAVTFCYEAGMDTEEMQIAYGTPIKNVVPNTRVDGNAVLTWSKTQGGDVWNGNVVGEMVLYAVEYAPVIELDLDGGKDAIPVVARAGSVITLPTPSKDLAEFTHWVNEQGSKYTSTTMPSQSITLKAIWQPKIVFNSNGGSQVNNISKSEGASITLPTPEREGYIFAGWYTTDKEEYTANKMPAKGLLLKAGWYKPATKILTLVKLDEYRVTSKTAPSMENSIVVDLSDLYAMGVKSIDVKMNFLVAAEIVGVVGHMTFYSSPTASSAYLVWQTQRTPIKKMIYEGHEEYTTMTLDFEKLYFCRHASNNSGMFTDYSVYFSDVYLTITYPDTSNLIL